MLKRHRAASPSPSSPDTPMFPSDPSSSDLSHHVLKRRRVFAPSLDDPSLGWGPPPAASDDGEDDYIEDDEARPGHHGPGGKLAQGMEDATEYKAVNSLLHDLHAEHQYRRVLSSTSHTTPFRDDCYPILAAASPVAAMGKQITLSQPFFPPRFGNPEPVKTSPFGTWSTSTPEPVNDVIIDESLRVQERYEDTNRLLRNAFLDRRRRFPESPGL